MKTLDREQKDYYLKLQKMEVNRALGIPSTWETELERTINAPGSAPTHTTPRRDIHPALIVAIVDSFILGVFFLFNPDLAEVGGLIICGSALVCIAFVAIANRKHIRRQLR